MAKDKPPNIVLRFLEQLKSSYLLMLLSALFAVDLFIPDPLPFLDEAVLGIVTLLMARWRMRSAEPEQVEKPPTKVVTPEASHEPTSGDDDGRRSSDP